MQVVNELLAELRGLIYQQPSNARSSYNLFIEVNTMKWMEKHSAVQYSGCRGKSENSFTSIAKIQYQMVNAFIEIVMKVEK